MRVVLSNHRGTGPVVTDHCKLTSRSGWSLHEHGREKSASAVVVTLAVSRARAKTFRRHKFCPTVRCLIYTRDFRIRVCWESAPEFACHLTVPTPTTILSSPLIGHRSSRIFNAQRRARGRRMYYRWVWCNREARNNFLCEQVLRAKISSKQNLFSSVDQVTLILLDQKADEKVLSDFTIKIECKDLCILIGPMYV